MGKYDNNRDFQFADSAGLDSFGKQRVSNARTLWDHKNIHSKYSDLWNEKVSGGGTITHLSNESAVGLTVGTASGDYAIRSTRRYFAYSSGNSHQFIQTYVFPPAELNRVVEAGYYDGPADPGGATWGNGIFLRQEDLSISFVIRSDVNENPAGAREVNENVILQDDWNKDKLNGTGPSGLTLDLETTQIEEPDFQWLGVGRVRCILNIDGQAIIVHEENHANAGTAVYMRSPTLPIRYLIWNKGVTTTGATLKEICSTVKSESDYTIPGIEYSADVGGADRGPTGGINARVAVGTTEIPVLIIRLANTINGMKNRKVARFLEANFSTVTNEALFRIAHVHDITSIDAYWYPIDGIQTTPGSGDALTSAESGVQYAYENLAQNAGPVITGGESHFVKPKYVSTGQGNRATSESVDAGFVNNHSYIAQNFDSTNSEVLVVYAQGEGATANVWASIDFIEFE